MLQHHFIVRVEGIRELEVASSTVWGEADCFVQYHFPTLLEEEHGADTAGECYSVPCMSAKCLCLCCL